MQRVQEVQSQPHSTLLLLSFWLPFLTVRSTPPWFIDHAKARTIIIDQQFRLRYHPVHLRCFIFRITSHIMENPDREPGFDVEIGTLPPLYYTILRPQSDKHDVGFMLPPYPLSTPMYMPMPMPTAPHVNESISERVQEDGEPVLKSRKTHNVVSNLSNEEVEADSTNKGLSSQRLRNF